MAKAKTIEKKIEDAPIVDLVETNDAELLSLRAQIEQFKSEAGEREALEKELAELKKNSDRKGGKKLEDPTALYRFSNRYDPGMSFIGTNGWPKTVGGRNFYTNYTCEDGAEIELPIRYAKELNKKRFPLPKWTKDDDGNTKKTHNVKVRYAFDKVED